jgi:hypothetical protein
LANRLFAAHGSRWNSSEDEIARSYRITAEQIRACVAYAQNPLNEGKVFAIAKCSSVMRLCANENVAEYVPQNPGRKQPV